MVSTVVLSGFVLLSLLSPWVGAIEGKGVDSNTLARIIQFIEDNYKLMKNGRALQYALAINIPQDQCEGKFDGATLLANNNPKKVTEDLLSKKTKNTYIGEGLIAAGVHNGIHSEYLLLNPIDWNTAPMKKLLQERKNGCVVFFTLNSPCVRQCLNPDCMDNILQMLPNIGENSALDVLVFNKLYVDKVKPETREARNAAYKRVVADMPLYRCTDTFGVFACLPCGGKSNSPIANGCLSDDGKMIVPK